MHEKYVLICNSNAFPAHMAKKCMMLGQYDL